jgi:hypothetical protein
MKVGTENRNKTILLGVLGTCALLGAGYTLYDTFGGSSPTPPSAVAPVAKTMNANNAALNEPAPVTVARSSDTRAGATPAGNAPGVAATKIASTSASLDPTLDPSAMLRTEHLVYAGSGRNIFSAIYVPEVKKIEEAKFSPRPSKNPGPVVPPEPPKPPTCPPSCPPINLKFFGTATRGNVRQAFLLQGDDVFLASPGDIVARRYRIVSIAPNSLQVEDMTNNNTQTLPLQSN